MPLDHIGLKVPSSKFEETKSFYLSALAPLGYTEIMSFPMAAGYGVDGKPDFWVSQAEGSNEKGEAHVAFTTKDRKIVHAFHEAALKAGAKCNGPPGPRAHYTPTYYGAFVLDLVGNNVEVVCHCPDAAENA